MELTVRAHAKINWSLAICGERPNGYHELDMLMQRIELSDELYFAPARRLTLNGADAADSDNLVIRAAKALNAACAADYGAEIRLTKRIPARAGLGGGSADCAATLIALNRLWNLRLPMEKLSEIGLRLGADVPFCLLGGMARAQGVGEILTPMADAPRIPMAMVTPGGGLSTPAVFRAWNAGAHATTSIDNLGLAQALRGGDLALAQALSHNDLEAPAIELMPEIGACIARFRACGASFVRMTGSGSTVFAAFEREADARAAAAAVPGALFTRSIGAA